MRRDPWFQIYLSSPESNDELVESGGGGAWGGWCRWGVLVSADGPIFLTVSYSLRSNMGSTSSGSLGKMCISQLHPPPPQRSSPLFSSLCLFCLSRSSLSCSSVARVPCSPFHRATVCSGAEILYVCCDLACCFAPCCCIFCVDNFS